MFVSLARKQRLSRLSSCSPEQTSSPSDRTLCWQAHDSCPLCCTSGVCAAKQAGVCSEAGCGDWYAICRTSSCLDYLGDAIGNGAPHTARLSSRLRLLHGFLSLITPRPTLGPTASSVSARCVEYTRLSAKQVHPISPNLAQSRPISPNLTCYPRRTATLALRLTLTCPPVRWCYWSSCAPAPAHTSSTSWRRTGRRRGQRPGGRLSRTLPSLLAPLCPVACDTWAVEVPQQLQQSMPHGSLARRYFTRA